MPFEMLSTFNYNSDRMLLLTILLLSGLVASQHPVADFQRDPVRLVKALSDAALDKKSARESAFDLDLAVEHAFGSERWSQLKQEEKTAVNQAFDRAVAEQLEDWVDDAGGATAVLNHQVTGAKAVVLTLRGYDLLRVSLVSRNNAWFIVEIEDLDSAISVLGQSLRGALDPRANRLRLLDLEPTRALKELDALLAEQKDSAELLLVKALVLARKQFLEGLEPGAEPAKRVEKKRNEKTDEARLTLEKIIQQWPSFAPAYFQLAGRLAADASEGKRKIELLETYARLMPPDPRAWTAIAETAAALHDPAKAEAAYGEAIMRNEGDLELRMDLLAFHVGAKQLEKARMTLAIALRIGGTDDVFEWLEATFSQGFEADLDPAVARQYELLLLQFPTELNSSKVALRVLATTQRVQGKYLEAIRAMERSIVIKAELEDLIFLAQLNREAKRLRSALAAADKAIKLNPEKAGGHLERAYALVALNRYHEALVSLKRAIELSPELRESLATDEDLKPVASLPAFKELVAQP